MDLPDEWNELQSRIRTFAAQQQPIQIPPIAPPHCLQQIDPTITTNDIGHLIDLRRLLLNQGDFGHEMVTTALYQNTIPVLSNNRLSTDEIKRRVTNLYVDTFNSESALEVKQANQMKQSNAMNDSSTSSSNPLIQFSSADTNQGDGWDDNKLYVAGFDMTAIPYSVIKALHSYIHSKHQQNAIPASSHDQKQEPNTVKNGSTSGVRQRSGDGENNQENVKLEQMGLSAGTENNVPSSCRIESISNNSSNSHLNIHMMPCHQREGKGSLTKDVTTGNSGQKLGSNDQSENSTNDADNSNPTVNPPQNNITTSSKREPTPITTQLPAFPHPTDPKLLNPWLLTIDPQVLLSHPDPIIFYDNDASGDVSTFAICCLSLFEYPSKKLVMNHVYTVRLRAPYISSYFAFKEAPPIMAGLIDLFLAQNNGNRGIQCGNSQNSSSNQNDTNATTSPHSSPNSSLNTSSLTNHHWLTPPMEWKQLAGGHKMNKKHPYFKSLFEIDPTLFSPSNMLQTTNTRNNTSTSQSEQSNTESNQSNNGSSGQIVIPTPDILITDSNGTLHQFRAGLAVHLSVLAQIPTIGVAKTAYTADGVQAKLSLPLIAPTNSTLPTLVNSGDKTSKTGVTPVDSSGTDSKKPQLPLQPQVPQSPQPPQQSQTLTDFKYYPFSNMNDLLPLVDDGGLDPNELCPLLTGLPDPLNLSDPFCGGNSSRNFANLGHPPTLSASTVPGDAQLTTNALSATNPQSHNSSILTGTPQASSSTTTTRAQLETFVTHQIDNLTNLIAISRRYQSRLQQLQLKQIQVGSVDDLGYGMSAQQQQEQLQKQLVAISTPQQLSPSQQRRPPSPVLNASSPHWAKLNARLKKFAKAIHLPSLTVQNVVSRSCNNSFNHDQNQNGRTKSHIFDASNGNNDSTHDTLIPTTCLPVETFTSHHPSVKNSPNSSNNHSPQPNSTSSPKTKSTSAVKLSSFPWFPMIDNAGELRGIALDSTSFYRIQKFKPPKKAVPRNRSPNSSPTRSPNNSNSSNTTNNALNQTSNASNGTNSNTNNYIPPPPLPFHTIDNVNPIYCSVGNDVLLGLEDCVKMILITSNGHKIPATTAEADHCSRMLTRWFSQCCELGLFEHLLRQ